MVVSRDMWSTQASYVTPTMTVELRRYAFPSPNVSIEEEQRPILSLSLPCSASDGHARFDGGGSCAGLAPLGPIIFRPAGIPLHAEGTGGPRLVLICEFDTRLFSRVTNLEDWTPSRLKRCVDVKSPALMMDLRRIVAEIRDPGFGTELLIDALATPLLVSLTRGVASANLKVQAPRGGLADWQVRRIRERLTEAVGAWPSTVDLAAACGVSRSHLSRNFTRSVGCTLQEFATSIRVARAQALLESGRYRMAEIAFQLGFASSTSFATAFRNTTWITPGEHARRHRSSKMTTDPHPGRAAMSAPGRPDRQHGSASEMSLRPGSGPG